MMLHVSAKAGADLDTTLGTVLARLEASADRLALLREETDAEKSRRDQLITEARDLGASWRTLGARGRLSVSGCVAVVNGA